MWSKFPWKWGKGLCQLLRVKPLLAGSAPPPRGVPSRLQECRGKSLTSSGWRGVTEERPSVGAQLSPEGGRRSRKQEDGVERGRDHLLGKVRWSRRGRPELFYPQVWTILGTERCGRSTCSLMIMIIMRPSAHPLPHDPLVPALWSPCLSLNAAELPRRCTLTCSSLLCVSLHWVNAIHCIPLARQHRSKTYATRRNRGGGSTATG